MTPDQDQESPDTIRVLHVDDESDFQFIAKRMLQTFDPALNIEYASTPKEALKLLKSEMFDCVVSDYQMPSMDGVELAKQIRESSDIPIIMYTGKGSEEVASRAFSAGVDDYIRKEMDPSHYEVLTRRIRAAVGAYRSEKSLNKREQELSWMIENSIDGIFRVEMARGVTRCNPAFLRFFGYSLEELQSMGMGLLDLIHDGDKAQFRSELDALSSRRLENYSSLNRWHTKNGEVIWLDSSVTALVQDEKFIGVEIIARDVTEQRLAEEEIRSLARFPGENTNPVLRISEEGVILYANAASESLLEEWKTEIGQAAPKDWLQHVSEALDTGATEEFEVVHQEQVFSFSVAPVSEAGYVNVYGRDITERKRIEEELERSEETYRTLLEEGMDSAAIVVDSEYVYVNKTFVEMLGYSVSEMLGMRTSEIVDPRDAGLLAEIIERRKNGEKQRIFYELRARKKDGSTIWMAISSIGGEFEGKRATISNSRDITERRMEEEALKASEEQYRTLFDSIIDDVLVIDPKDYTIIKVNNIALKSLKMVETDVVGKKCYEVTHILSAPCAPPNHTCPLKQIQESGESSIIEHRHFDDDGNPFFVEVSASPIRDKEGNIVQILHISKDITELRRLMEELSKSEELYKTLLEELKDAVFVLDHEKYLYVNQYAKELLGFNHSYELIGRDAFEFIAPEDREKVRDYSVRRQRGEEVPSRYEFSFVNKEGSKIPVEVQVSLIEYEGKPASLAINRVITERKRLEEETRQYQKRLEALHSHSSHLALASTVEKVSKVTLDTMTDALGFDLQAFQTVENDILIVRGTRGGPPWNMPLPMDGKGITAKAAREARSILLNDVRDDPDFVMGSTESLSELAVPVISEGRVVAVLNVESVRLDAFTLRDQQLLELLANHVASALMRIWSQRNLEEVRKRHSVELVRGIQRVSSMVRHDLRGPLQTIMNANYLLGKDSDSFDEMREIITSSVKHANEIMEDWKKQGIDERLTLSDTEVSALIKEALDISLIPSNIKTSMDIEPMVLHLDRVITRRVLDNLIRNAVEAMPEGGALSMEGRVDGDIYVIEVKDTGIGISRDGLSKLFTPFYTTKPDGMGLGLAFCKRTIEAHGGTIEVNTTEGKGTTFTINIPTSLSFQYSQSVQLDEMSVDRQA